MKKNLLLIVIATLLTFLILWPIHRLGDWYTMHDSSHPARVFLMSVAMHSGQFPPIWANWANGGYGYPLFHFYAPLFHLFATSLYYFFPIQTTTVLKITLLVSGIIGTLGCMLFAKRWGKLAAIVSGTAFALAPYLAVNLYVRGAFSEYLSLCLIPWVFLATEKIDNKKRMVLAALALSLFVLSHNLIPILVLPMVIIWILFNNHKKFHLSVGAILLSVAISSWFVGPLLFERNFTLADQVARKTEYSLHFVEPWQLWNSTWGFGGSAPGVEDGMSFKVGKIQIILGLLGLVVALLQKRKNLILLGVFTALAFFLATPYSKVVWDSLKTLQIVQFPWRGLGIISVFLAILSGFAVSRFPSRVVRTGVVVITVVSLIFLNFKYFKPQTIVTTPIDKSAVSIDEVPDIAPLVAEYQPIWWHPENLPTTEGDGNIAVLTSDNVKINDGMQDFNFWFDVEASESGTVSFGAAYYPTWEGKVDGNKVEVKPDEAGLASLDLPAGKHHITLKQGHTNLEKISYGITILSFIYLLYIWRRSAKS